MEQWAKDSSSTENYYQEAPSWSPNRKSTSFLQG